MNNTITFTVAGIPRPWARMRRAKSGHSFKSKSVKLAEQSFIVRSREHRPDKPHDGPVSIDLAFYMPAPKSPKWRREYLLSGAPHVNTPDLDNLTKLVLDCMTGEWWVDDRQVFDVSATKLYGDPSRTEVLVEFYPPLPATKAEVRP